MQVSACSVAAEIASSGVPISIMAGWPDLTASPGIHAFYHATKAPGEFLLAFLMCLELRPLLALFAPTLKIGARN